MELSTDLLLAMWLASGAPAAVATARFDRPLVAFVVALVGPLAWFAWLLARRRHLEDIEIACSHRFLSKV